MKNDRIKAEIEIAETHYKIWLDAEAAIATSQSYSIGSRSLTRADLKEVRGQIDYWRQRRAQLGSLLETKGRNRITRAVPRDL